MLDKIKEIKDLENKLTDAQRDLSTDLRNLDVKDSNMKNFIEVLIVYMDTSKALRIIESLVSHKWFSVELGETSDIPEHLSFTINHELPEFKCDGSSVNFTEPVKVQVDAFSGRTADLIPKRRTVYEFTVNKNMAKKVVRTSFDIY